MADELNSLNFNIIDTTEMGSGSTELLDGLFGAESVTTKSTEIEELKKEPKKVEPKKIAKKEELKKPKVEKQNEDEDEDEEDNALGSFLEEEEENNIENEEETEKPSLKNKKKSELQKSEETEEEEEENEVDGPNQFAALAKDLFELGVFSKDEDESDVTINSPQEFLERFNQEKQKGANQMIEKFIGQFGEDYQAAFQAIYLKGVNPKDYFSTYNEIEDLSNLDLKQESNQLAVIKQGLKDQGWEDEDVAVEIERLKNYGDLEGVATRHHKVLVKNQAAKLEKLERESEARTQAQKTLKNQYIKNVQNVLENKLKTNEFDGIPINPQLAKELQDFLLIDKYQTKSGELLTEFDRTILDLKNPENHERKVKVALLLKILEKDPTLSTIQKTGISKKTNQLFSEVVRQSGKSSSKSDKQTKDKSWFER